MKMHYSATAKTVERPTIAELKARSDRGGARDKGKRSNAKDDPPKKIQSGVCYAFQAGKCSRGDACRFSH